MEGLELDFSGQEQDIRGTPLAAPLGQMFRSVSHYFASNN